MVAGGLSLMDKATWVTSEISEVILLEMVWTTFQGSSATDAVIASIELTTLTTIRYPKSL